jgi:hypothetical protein
VRDDLPGADLVRDGFADLAEGRMTVAALLVAIGAPRLRRLGLPVPPDHLLPRYPERDLYELLEREGRGAHSCFNALIRRLVSFERALEHERPTTPDDVGARSTGREKGAIR